MPETLNLIDEEGGFSLVETLQGKKLVLAIHPEDKELRAKICYGANRLKVVANDTLNPRQAYVDLTLKDFPIFGVAMTAFSQNTQTAKLDGAGGYRFQGWLNVLAPSTVSDVGGKGTRLTVGLFNLVNPH